MTTDWPDYAASKPTLARQLPFEGSWPTSVALLGDGPLLVAGNQAGQIVVWDLAAEPEADFKPSGDRQAPPVRPTRLLRGHTNGITRLAASPDGQTLISASLDHTVRLWDPAAAAVGREPLVLDAESRERESKRSGGKSSVAPTNEVDVGEAVAVLEGHDDWVQSLGISRNGRRLISGDAAARVIVWDLLARREVQRLSGLPWNWIVAAALSPDGAQAVVSEFRYKRDDFDIPAAAVRVWDVAAAAPTLDLLKIEFPKYDPTVSSYEAAQTWRKFTGDGLVAADFSPDGTLLALGQGGETDTGKVHLFSAESGKLLRTVSGHRYGVTDVRFSRDGRFVLSTGRDTTLRICNVADGKEVAALGSPRGGQFKDWLSAVAVSDDGRTLAAADIAGLIHVWTV